MECKVDKGKSHSLTGGREEFAGMAGENMQCYKYCADSLIYSMSELRTAKPMEWTCSFCRSKSDSKVMNTETDEVCVNGCGHTGMNTLKTHLVAGLRAIMSCSGFTVDNDRTVVPINFSNLGEKLLYPHGQPRGMLCLVDHQPVAEDRVCN